MVFESDPVQTDVVLVKELKMRYVYACVILMSTTSVHAGWLWGANTRVTTVQHYYGVATPPAAVYVPAAVYAASPVKTKPKKAAKHSAKAAKHQALADYYSGVN